MERNTRVGKYLYIQCNPCNYYLEYRRILDRCKNILEECLETSTPKKKRAQDVFTSQKGVYY